MKSGCFQPSDFTTDKLWRCYHSGDLGDIIYSLLFCKTLGNIQMMIGPDSRAKVREPMTPTKFNWLAPLLRDQSWIKSVEYLPHPPSVPDYNLNDFRRTWFSPESGLSKRRSLAQTYAEHFGHPAAREDQPWLISDPHIDHARPVVISRSPRFHNPHFPWKQIANQYDGRMRFLGLEQEFKAWTSEFGNAASFHPVKNSHDIAMSIAGSSLFIGNQSFPMAVALGLGVSLVQEAWPNGPDCILRRLNAIFYNEPMPLKLPDIDRIEEHEMSSMVFRDGLYHLGPMAGGAGLGDTLMILPLAKALGNKTVMFLPARMGRFAFLFRNACPVRISNNYPVFHYRSGILQSAELLRKFNLSHVSPVPSLEISAQELAKARQFLSQYPSPIAFCPTCSKVWEHARQRPFLFWKPIVAELKKRFTVLQFGRTDYPTLDGAVRMPFVPLEELAPIYSVIGNYIGVDTGDYHLMIAAGGRAIVAQQDPWTEEAAWSYNLPHRVVYGKLRSPFTVLDAMKRLPL